MSLDTRFAPNCFAVGYIGQPKPQPTDLPAISDVITVDADTFYEKAIEVNAAGIIGPIVGKTKDETAVRICLVRYVDKPFEQHVYFRAAPESAPVSSAEIEKSLNVFGLFTGRFNPAKRYFMTEEEINNPYTRRDDLLKNVAATGRPEFNEDRGFVCCAYYASTVDQLCGTVISGSKYLKSSFEPFVPTCMHTYTLCSDAEGDHKNLETAKNIHETLGTNKLAFLGDAVDHGNENLKCVDELLTDAWDITIAGNRDLNKMRINTTPPRIMTPLSLQFRRFVNLTTTGAAQKLWTLALGLGNEANEIDVNTEIRDTMKAPGLIKEYTLMGQARLHEIAMRMREYLKRSLLVYQDGNCVFMHSTLSLNHDNHNPYSTPKSKSVSEWNTYWEGCKRAIGEGLTNDKREEIIALGGPPDISPASSLGPHFHVHGLNDLTQHIIT